MAYPIAIGNADVAAPINEAAPAQMGGRNVVQLNQPAPQVLLQALDQVRVDQVQMQRRLEAQVQQGEEALFQAVQRNAELTKQLNQSVSEANAQRNRANGLDGQLAIERQERANLGVLLRQWQDQEHVLRGQAESAAAVKNDIECRLDASDARSRVLEQQILNERVSAERKNILNELLIKEARLEREVSNLVTPQVAGLTGIIITGFFVGGPLGGAVAFLGGCGVGLFTPLARQEEAYLLELCQVRREITKNREVKEV